MKRIKIGNETMNICSPNLTPDIHMTHTGRVHVILANSYTLPTTTFHETFKFKLKGQYLEWTPVSFTKGNHSQVFTADLHIKEDPWLIKTSDNLIVEVCTHTIEHLLRDNCLQLTHHMPLQISATEKAIVGVVTDAALAVSIVLSVMNIALLDKVYWNPPPTFFADLLLLCHVLATHTELPGAVTEFN